MDYILEKKQDLDYDFIFATNTMLAMRELDDAVRKQILMLKKVILKDREGFLERIKTYLSENKTPKRNYDKQIIKLCERDKQLDQLSEKVIEKNLSGLIALDTADSILKKYKAEKNDI